MQFLLVWKEPVSRSDIVKASVGDSAASLSGHIGTRRTQTPNGEGMKDI